MTYDMTYDIERLRKIVLRLEERVRLSEADLKQFIFQTDNLLMESDEINAAVAGGKKSLEQQKKQYDIVKKKYDWIVENIMFRHEWHDQDDQE